MKKNYVKLIGSLLVMICMALGIVCYVNDSKAATDTVVYLMHEDYVAEGVDGYTLNEKGVPVYEGYLFAGYYEEAESSYDPVKSISNLPGGTYVAKFVPEEVLTVKAQISESILNNQTSNASENMIRFVTSIDESVNYQKVGFTINVGGYWEQDVDVDEYVYKKIYAVGATEETQETYEPNIFSEASAYMKTYTFTDIPQDYLNEDITVTPYWVTLDGTRIDGTTAVRTVDFCRAWVYVDSSANAVTNAAAPVGTYSNPYSDLQEAVDVDGKTLVPKVILKSDYELASTVTVAKSLTLASANENSIVRADSWTADRMLKIGNESAVDVILEDITINGANKGAAVIIYNGNLLMEDGSVITRGRATAGGNVEVDNTKVKNCTLTMKTGSTISDGNATGADNYVRGGNIILEAGTVTIDGGSITGGTATTTENTTVANTGCGGNIHSFASGTIVMKRGEISNGAAIGLADVEGTGMGGNICSAGIIQVQGGTISGGTALNGGSIYTTKTLTVSDGIITGGIATTDSHTPYTGLGGNVYVSDTATMNVTGGTIEKGTAKQILTTETTDNGNSTIGYEGCGGNIYNAGTLKINGGSISKGIASTTQQIRHTGCGGNIFSVKSFEIKGTTENKAEVTLGRAEATVSNNWFGLGGNITMLYSSTISLDIENATISEGYAKGRGGNINLNSNVTLDLTNASLQGGNTDGNGGSIFAQGGCSININNGGIISGGTAAGNGGNIMYNASGKTIKLVTGGQIINGNANLGGCISITSGKLDLQGGTISGGTAKKHGGNIYNEKGIITMSGGTIQDGVAKNNYGGNVYLHAATNVSGTFTMNGGTISGGTAGTSTVAGRGGNIYVAGVNKTDYASKFIINSGNVIDGKSAGITNTAGRGGNVMLGHGAMEIGSGLINIAGGHTVTLNTDGSVKSTVAANNLDVFGRTTTHFAKVIGELNVDSRIGFQSSNAGKAIEIATEALQSQEVYDKVFVLDSTSETAKLKLATETVEEVVYNILSYTK